MVRRTRPDAGADRRYGRRAAGSGNVGLSSELHPDLHPELTPSQRRELLRRGVDLYRAGRYFDCHEAFEEVWRSTTPEPKDLIQGLIQIAVGVYHHRRGKPDVAARVLAKGRCRVEPYPSPSLGLDLETLLADVRRWEARLAAGSEPGAPPALHLIDADALR